MSVWRGGGVVGKFLQSAKYFFLAVVLPEIAICRRTKRVYPWFHPSRGKKIQQLKLSFFLPVPSSAPTPSSLLRLSLFHPDSHSAPLTRSHCPLTASQGYWHCSVSEKIDDSEQATSISKREAIHCVATSDSLFLFLVCRGLRNGSRMSLFSDVGQRICESSLQHFCLRHSLCLSFFFPSCFDFKLSSWRSHTRLVCRAWRMRFVYTDV